MFANEFIARNYTETKSRFPERIENEILRRWPHSEFVIFGYDAAGVFVPDVYGRADFADDSHVIRCTGEKRFYAVKLENGKIIKRYNLK